MSYEVTIAPAAARQLRKFDPQVRRRIQAAIELLAIEPRPPAATRLVGGAGEWRVRTGDYRIIYEIKDEQLLVLVSASAIAARSTSGELSSRRTHQPPSGHPAADGAPNDALRPAVDR